MAIDKETAAYKAGEALQVEILKSGVTAGIVRQFTAIIKNYSRPDCKVQKAFIEGLLGVVKDAN